MLVGALEVHLGGTMQAGVLLADRGMRDATLPPDVEDVLLGDELGAAAVLAGRARGKVLGGIAAEPGVGALRAEELDDRIEGLRGGDGLATALAGEDRDGHAPGALTRDAPVGAVGDHRTDAVHRPLGIPGDLVDLVQRPLAQTRGVHGDEPLVGRPEDDRLMATPAMGIAVRYGHMGDEHTALAEPVDDDRIRLVDVHPGEGSSGLREDAVVVDGHQHAGAVPHAGEVVVLAMAGSRMHGTGTGGELDVVAEDDDAGGIGEYRAAVLHAQHVGALDPHRLAIPPGEEREGSLPAG